MSTVSIRNVTKIYPGHSSKDAPVLALDDVGFDGFAVIEYEADPQDPAKAIKTSVERIRAV